MATTERARPGTRGNRLVYVALGVLIVAGVVAAALAMKSPPQMGTDEEVFNTVDALFTAVTSRDEQRLGQCEQRLRTYRADGKLPAEAASYLDSVIQSARAGRWESASERLYDFMKAQRRDGASEHKPKKKDRPDKRK